MCCSYGVRCLCEHSARSVEYFGMIMCYAYDNCEKRTLFLKPDCSQSFDMIIQGCDRAQDW